MKPESMTVPFDLWLSLSTVSEQTITHVREVLDDEKDKLSRDYQLWVEGKIVTEPAERALIHDRVHAIRRFDDILELILLHNSQREHGAWKQQADKRQGGK